ncbi:MAG TPA: helix-turn-helix transcriptional regulator [Patescibacteria group bacterium]|nr:helix-turn-helix transcriptional regulator [Patescibacteria group bacterium]
MATFDKPYSKLGKHLKTLRVQTKRSLAEVSGAVEIEEKFLRQIEEGHKRPAEDLMLLFISYFNLPDQEAMSIWSLAKYKSDLTEHLDISSDGSNAKDDISQLNAKNMVMMFSVDIRTMYTDGVEVTWNPAGLTINFTQTSPITVVDNPMKNLPVARVGMSYDQANKVISTLQTALLHAKYTHRNKLLPPNIDNE